MVNFTIILELFNDLEGLQKKYSIFGNNLDGIYKNSSVKGLIKGFKTKPVKPKNMNETSKDIHDKIMISNSKKFDQYSKNALPNIFNINIQSLKRSVLGDKSAITKEIQKNIFEEIKIKKITPIKLKPKQRKLTPSRLEKVFIINKSIAHA